MFYICFVRENSEGLGRCVLSQFYLREYKINHDCNVPHLEISEFERKKLCEKLSEIKNQIQKNDVIGVYLCEENKRRLVALIRTEEICNDLKNEITRGIETSEISLCE